MFCLFVVNCFGLNVETASDVSKLSVVPLAVVVDENSPIRASDVEMFIKLSLVE